MKKATMTAFIVGSFLLAGCAETNQYPVTGTPVGLDDQVKYMSMPMEVARY